MSRRAERRQKRWEKLKAELRTALLTALLGLLFLGLGTAGLIGSAASFRAYRESDSIVHTEAEVTRVQIRTKKDLDGTPFDVYDVELRFTVDGTEYRGKTRLYAPAKTGDVREIEVFRTPKGEYRIPEIRSGEELAGKNLLPLMSVGVGAILTLAGCVVAFDRRKSLHDASGGNAGAQAGER